MIEYPNKDTIKFICDNCSEIEQFNNDNNFLFTLNLLKDLGWKMRKDGSNWEHYCPNCEINQWE